MRLTLLYIIQHSQSVVTWLTLLILLWLQIVLFRSTFSIKKAKLAGWLLISVWLLSLLIYSLALWMYFAGSSYAKALLPPSSNFLFERITQGLVTYLSGAIGAMVLFFVLQYFFLKKSQGRMIDAADVTLLTITSLALGWPTILIFLAMVFLVSVFGMLLLVMVRKKNINDRLIITPFILPSAVITLFTGPYFLSLTHLDKIRF